MHHMFESYAEYDEPIPEEQKIRLLFQKVDSSAPEVKKAALMVQHDLDFAHELTYGWFSNQLLKEVPRAVDQASNRQASGVANIPPSDVRTIHSVMVMNNTTKLPKSSLTSETYRGGSWEV